MARSTSDWVLQRGPQNWQVNLRSPTDVRLLLVILLRPFPCSDWIGGKKSKRSPSAGRSPLAWYHQWIVGSRYSLNGRPKMTQDGWEKTMAPSDTHHAMGFNGFLLGVHGFFLWNWLCGFTCYTSPQKKWFDDVGSYFSHLPGEGC